MTNETKKMQWLPAGAVKLNGELGRALQKSVRNRLCKINYQKLVEPFRLRNENDGGWRCEFWGKNIRGAILSWYLTQDPELEALIRQSANELIATQTADGCISSYPAERQLTSWDVWGRKYALLGLIRYYDLMGQDERVPGVCARMLDHLRQQLNGRSLRDCSDHGGLAASSILGGVVDTYRITGQERFLDFALEIVKSGACQVHNIFDLSAHDVPPSLIGNGKAYEMMSCFQGLAKLQQYRPNAPWLQADMNFFKNVCKDELFITGGAGAKDYCGEFWFNGTRMQTVEVPTVSGGLGETCITVTWLHFCNELLQLTGDAVVPATLERTVYNALLGATDYDCGRWIHRNPTPLVAPATKVPTKDQILTIFRVPFDGHDCCLAQGPEGLAMAAAMALMESADNDGAWYLNFYEPMEASRFRLEGGYPFNGDNMQLTFTTECDKPLYLLVSKHLKAVKYNGTTLEITPDSYLCAGKSFRKGDSISLEFDMALKEHQQAGWRAFTTGPIVLAQDSRLTPVGDTLRGTDFAPATPPPQIRTVLQNSSGQMLCDYASAGNLLDADNTLQVWLK